jgi:GT2 family glycosyltransferase
VESDFDWEQRTDELAERLDGVAAGTALAPPPPAPAPADDPELSVVVLAWDNLRYTQLFVESVRQHTGVPFELVIVDNGSAWEAASYAAAAADTSVLNDRNLGFAKGMNQGFAVARGGYVAFCNNDTILPPGWAEQLLQTARAHPSAGIVVPALTQARNDVTVRSKPGTGVEVLLPFSAPPAAVVYVMPAEIVRGIGAWGEEYEIASGEDVDLAFKVWANDLDIVYDQRVLVQHIGKGSASRLDDWQGLWQRNRRRFLDKWMGDAPVPRLESCPPDRFARNRAITRATAQWMDRYFTTRDKLPKPGLLARGGLVHRRLHRWGRAGWRRARPHLPPRVVRAISRARAAR